MKIHLHIIKHILFYLWQECRSLLKRTFSMHTPSNCTAFLTHLCILRPCACHYHVKTFCDSKAKAHAIHKRYTHLIMTYSLYIILYASPLRTHSHIYMCLSRAGFLHIFIYEEVSSICVELLWPCCSTCV